MVSSTGGGIVGVLYDTAMNVTYGVPFYSGVDLLRRALGSVRAQEDPAWRAFVCDDSVTTGQPLALSVV